MLGFAADIPDQTCKTAAQSRTRIVGHRQLPWIQLNCSLPSFRGASETSEPGISMFGSGRILPHHLGIPDQSAGADCPE
jgi:hypothetical protein